MASAKFKVTLRDIPEEKLGSVLGSLPDKIPVEIECTHRRTTAPAKTTAIPNAVPEATQAAPVAHPSSRRDEFGAYWFDTLPPVFKAKDLVPIIEAHGFNGNSISHFLRRAIDAKMIQKVPGLLGNKVAYRKVVKR